MESPRDQNILGFPEDHSQRYRGFLQYIEGIMHLSITNSIPSKLAKAIPIRTKYLSLSSWEISTLSRARPFALGRGTYDGFNSPVACATAEEASGAP